MKKREGELAEEVQSENVDRSERVYEEAVQSQDKAQEQSQDKVQEEQDNGYATLHDVLMVQAMQENQDKLYGEVKKVMMQQMIVRAGLERQMALLDAQISGIDYKLEQLSALVESGQIIEAAEVRTFMGGGELVGIAIVNVTDEVKANRKRRTDLRL